MVYCIGIGVVEIGSRPFEFGGRGFESGVREAEGIGFKKRQTHPSVKSYSYVSTCA